MRSSSPAWDGPEFDGHLVDFDQAMKRSQMYRTTEGRAMLRLQEGDTHNGGCGQCGGGRIMADMLKKVPVKEQDPKVRATNFDEVCLGYTLEEAMDEATRCLDCRNAKCIQGCPVSIDIPGVYPGSKKKEI